MTESPAELAVLGALSRWQQAEAQTPLMQEKDSQLRLLISLSHWREGIGPQASGRAQGPG